MAIHPHDARIAAREVAYPNRAAEDEAVRAIDEQVFDRVRDFENSAAEEAAILLQKQRKHETQATEVLEQLRSEVRLPLMRGAMPTAELAKKYERLRLAAEQAKRSLESADAQTAFQAKTAADPYGAISELWKKYPLLRPNL